MIKEITVTAKTVEEAVLKAVEELGAPSAEVIAYTVVEEPKKGFLGIGDKWDTRKHVELYEFYLVVNSFF